MEKPVNDKITYPKIFTQLFTKPKSAFKLILEKDETMSQLVILGLFGFLNTITPILAFEPFGGLTLFKLIFKGLIGAVFGWLGIWFLSHLINLTNNLLKAETEFEDVYYIFSFSFCPMIVTFLVILLLHLVLGDSSIIIFLALILILVGYIWTFTLLLIGNKFLSKSSWIKNVIAVIIPLSLILAVNILMMKIMS